jgi:hypothetical protein
LQLRMLITDSSSSSSSSLNAVYGSGLRTLAAAAPSESQLECQACAVSHVGVAALASRVGHDLCVRSEQLTASSK